MKKSAHRHAVIFVLSFLLSCLGSAVVAAEFYVSPSGSDMNSGLDWARAKQTIQAAVDIAAAGDTVWVGDGTYSSGTRITPGFATLNRLVMTKDLTVRSVNGPAVTSIVGVDNGNVSSSVRGVFMTTGRLIGFTLSGGRAPSIGADPPLEDCWGGGAYAHGGHLENCIISGNDAAQGGGVGYGTLSDCEIRNNRANHGGGAISSVLKRCVVESNTAAGGGGGAEGGTLEDCVVRDNTALVGGAANGANLTRCHVVGNRAGFAGGASSSTLNNCLIENNTASEKWGAVVDGTLNQCTVVHNSAPEDGGVLGSDLTNSIVYFNTSHGAVSNGTDNSYQACLTTPLSAAGEGNLEGPPIFRGPDDFRLDPLSPGVNQGRNDLVVGTTDLDGNPRIVDGTVDIGAFEITRIRWVAKDGGNVFPYQRPADAAWSIQDAVDAAEPGERVVVADGTYDIGSRATPGFVTLNRLVIAKDISVESVNGPEVTVIRGNDAGDSPTSMRCVFMSAGSLSGFTLSGGFTPDLPPTFPENVNGGGALLLGGELRDCVITLNQAAGQGGGVSGGTVSDSLIFSNRAEIGGGAHQTTLIDSQISLNVASANGGGANGSMLQRCVVLRNIAGDLGGGLEGGQAENSLIRENSATSAGGAFGTTLFNCTVTANRAGSVGGIGFGNAFNSIVYHNFDQDGSPNYAISNFEYSCTTPVPGAGPGNIEHDPEFVSAQSAFLKAGSPCINAGNNALAPAGPDLAGRSRFSDNVVDMGAYDFDTYPVRYVSSTGANVHPYGSWASAAHNIQDAVDAADPGDLILVAPGVYHAGSRPTPGHSALNRVVVTEDVTIRSTQGAEVTVIEGLSAGDGEVTNVRGLYMTSGTLSGFTIRSGATPGAAFDPIEQTHGGGAFLTGGVLEDCVLRDNTASAGHGGAVYGGTLQRCLIRDNSAEFSGGASTSVLRNCVIVGNLGNFAGGAAFSTLENCTVTRNTVSFAGLGTPSGGVAGCTVRNSIVTNNRLGLFTNQIQSNHSDSELYATCTTYIPAGQENRGNIDDSPFFVDPNGRDLRLRPGSPCIDAGDNSLATGTIDFAGRRRIFNGTIDMGAIEFFIRPPGYEGWAYDITNGLDGPNDMPLADGLPNLLKYATGASATQRDQIARLEMESDGTIRFHRNSAATDIVMHVEQSPTLGTGELWTSIATCTNGVWSGAALIAEDLLASPVDVVVTPTNSGGERQFFRLRIAKP